MYSQPEVSAGYAYPGGHGLTIHCIALLIASTNKIKKKQQTNKPNTKQQQYINLIITGKRQKLQRGAIFGLTSSNVCNEVHTHTKISTPGKELGSEEKLTNHGKAKLVQRGGKKL